MVKLEEALLREWKQRVQEEVATLLRSMLEGMRGVIQSRLSYESNFFRDLKKRSILVCIYL